jgi:hypothetical protein
MLPAVAAWEAAAATTVHRTARTPACAGEPPFCRPPYEMGSGGGRCYNGTGFAEAAPHVERHAKSFSNQSQETFCALHFPAGGGCLYRTVHGGDYASYWEWWDKLDGVQSSRPTDCSPG